MSELGQLTERIVNFRNARDWQKFHKPKDMMLSLMLECAELAEHFQWKNDAEFQDFLSESKGKVADELADILYWVLLMAHDFRIELGQAFQDKMTRNEAKYPVEKAHGKSTKYSEL